MKTLIETTKRIFREDRGLFWFMIIVLVLSVFLFLFAVFMLDPNGTVINVGYNDIAGGYQNGAWTEMLTFPVLAIVFGVLHSLITLKIYEQKGGGSARMFLMVTIGLMIGVVILMLRLAGK